LVCVIPILFGIVLFGVLPTAFVWLLGWVIVGFKSN